MTNGENKGSVQSKEKVEVPRYGSGIDLSENGGLFFAFKGKKVEKNSSKQIVVG